MNERKKVSLLILIMAVIGAFVATITITLLYNASLEEQRARLVETAQSQARLIEAIARHDIIYEQDTPGGAQAATMSQITDAHENYKGFGETGEFTLAKHEGNKIVFLLSHRYDDVAKPEAIPFNSELAEAMRLALSGLSGTLIGLDYRGAVVLAAYEPVAVLDLGIVAKIDMTEVRAPFVRAGMIAGGTTILVILLGTYLFIRVTNPIIRRLQESEKSYHGIFAQARDGIVLVDKETGFIINCNPEFESQTGRQLEQLKKMTIWQIRPAEKIGAAQKTFFGISEEGRGGSSELEFQKPDGEIVSVEFVSTVVTIQGRNCLQTISRDITERKRAEETLQKQTNDLGDRVKELNCLYVISRLVEQDDLTVDEIFQSVTDIIPPSWQYPEITCARIRLSDKEFQTSNFVETAWKQSDVIVVNGKKTGTIDVHYLEEMPESDEGPFLKEERNLIHVIAERLGHIIEHRITQDSLQALYEQEKELRERVQSDMQRRVDFTRNLIHELKTPLTALLATSQLLYEEEQDKRLGRLAKYVWEGASDLNNWIDDLHDVVKGEIGTLKLEPKLFDVSKLLSSITSETRALAQQHGVTVTLNLSGDLPKVIADEIRVRQIVLNLLNNAFKYASEGGKVTITCSANDHFLKVEVEDRGPGIPLEEQRSLFESGYQAALSADPARGLGIGLALCKLLVELHEGQIWVNSKVGEGTSFIFTLPLQEKNRDLGR